MNTTVTTTRRGRYAAPATQTRWAAPTILIGLLVIVVAIVSACGADLSGQSGSGSVPIETEPVKPASGWEREQAEKAAEPEVTWADVEIELFTVLAEENIPAVLDAETCELIDLLGPDLFVDSFKDGFTESGNDWRAEYSVIVVDVIERNC